MAALKDLLPPVKSTSASFYDHSKDPWFKDRFISSTSEGESIVKAKPVPPYGKRQGFVPRKLEDFGDGGAFPEIHIAQYPLGMGRKDRKPRSKILPLIVDSQGKIAFDAIVKQNENASKIFYSQHSDLILKIILEEKKRVRRAGEGIQETTECTMAALEKIINVRLSAAQPKNVPTRSSDSTFIKYKPSQ